MEFSKIKYPSMRGELLHNLKKLSDDSYQSRVWVKNIYPENVEFDNFDLVVHFIFDDTSLGDDPASMLGVVLYNENEVELMSALVKALDILFEKYGTVLSDEDYMEKPEWARIVQSAQKAYSTMYAHET